MANLFDIKDAIEEVIRSRKLDPIKTKGKIGLKSGLIVDLIDKDTNDDDDKSTKLYNALYEILNESLTQKLKTQVKFYSFIIKYFIFTFICILTFWFSMFYFVNKFYAQNSINIAEKSMSESINVFKSLELEQLSYLSTLGNSIVNNVNIKSAFMTRDKHRLYNATNSIYRKYKGESKVAEIYFIGSPAFRFSKMEPDDKVFLRVHNPDLSGDVFTNEVYTKAVSSKSLCTGNRIEDGHITFVSVFPFYMGDDIIGYLVLCNQVENLLSNMKKQTGSDYATLGLNQYINSKDTVKSTLTDDSNNKLIDAKLTIIEQTLPFAVSNAFTGDFKEIPETGIHLGQIINSQNTYEKGIFPIFDTNSNKIGGILVLTDISKNSISFSEVKSNIIVVVIILTALMIMAFMYILYKYNKIINRFKTILETAEKVVGGNYDSDIEVNVNDHIGEIEQLVNQLKHLLIKHLPDKYK